MPRASHGLIFGVIALLVFGVVMVNSAGLAVRGDSAVSLVNILTGRAAMLAFLAVAALFIGAFVPIRRLFGGHGLASPAPWIVLAIVALLIAVRIPGVGREVNGAWRWIQFGPLGFQPSELAKWGMIIVIAWHATRRAGAMGRFRSGFLAPMLLVGIVCALIATEDLGTAVLVGMVCTLMLIAAGAKIWHAAILLPPALGGFLFALFASPYRLDRIRAFLDPFADPQGVGYHIVQSMAAINSGGLAGRGLGNSILKFGYLPEDTTDFIFAIICEELGLAGALVVIALYALVLLSALAIVRRVQRPFERLIGLGVILVIGLQALINIAVVTGAAPTKGIALPLLSAGGTGWVTTAFFIGLVISMDRRASDPTPSQEDDPIRGIRGLGGLATRIAPQ